MIFVETMTDFVLKMLVFQNREATGNHADPVVWPLHRKLQSKRRKNVEILGCFSLGVSREPDLRLSRCAQAVRESRVAGGAEGLRRRDAGLPARVSSPGAGQTVRQQEETRRPLWQRQLPQPPGGCWRGAKEEGT